MSPANRTASGQQPKQHNLLQQHGVLVVNKPKGISSAACIGRIKHGFGQKKIGHAGTLDPMAEGVLLVLLGQATKISHYLMQDGEKVYSGSIRLGVTTTTWDAEGDIIEEKPVGEIAETAIHKAMQELVGTYSQEVPAYSAAKHQGQPLYALARKGLETPVKSKTITISRGEVESVCLPHVQFRVTCSSGTYIRSLAHSLGMRLGCGAILEKLTREYSHPFNLDQAHSLEELSAQADDFASKVQSIPAALPDWPKITVTPVEADRVRHGMPLEQPANTTQFEPGTRAVLLEENNIPLALAETTISQGQLLWSILRGLWNPNPA